MKDLMNAYTLIDVVLIYSFAMLSLFYFLRLKQAKKQIKNYSFFSTCSAETIEGYETQIKIQECQIADVKKYFEDAVAEITELRNENKHLNSDLVKLYAENAKQDEHNGLLIDEIKDLTANRDYWKERSLHQKHSKQVKQIESEYWEAKTNPYGFFIKGNVYKQDKTIITDDSLIWIFLNENDLHSHLVERKYFKPVIK